MIVLLWIGRAVVLFVWFAFVALLVGRYMNRIDHDEPTSRDVAGHAVYRPCGRCEQRP